MVVGSDISYETEIVNRAEITSDNGDDVDSTTNNQSQDEDDDDSAVIKIHTECIPTTEVCDGEDNDCDGEIDE